MKDNRIVLLLLCLMVGGSRGYSLVIYAVDSLFTYYPPDQPAFNISQQFEQFAGLPAGISI